MSTIHVQFIHEVMEHLYKEKLSLLGLIKELLRFYYMFISITITNYTNRCSRKIYYFNSLYDVSKLFYLNKTNKNVPLEFLVF